MLPLATPAFRQTFLAIYHSGFENINSRNIVIIMKKYNFIQNKPPRVYYIIRM